MATCLVFDDLNIRTRRCLFIIVVIEVLTECVRMLNKKSQQIVGQGEADSEVIDAVYHSFSFTSIAGQHINRTA